MTNVEGRVVHLEILLNQVRAALESLKARLAADEQNIRQISWGGSGGGGGGGQALWVKATFAGASGTWPTITPSSGACDVYKDNGGTPTLIASGATVRWFYLDASGTDKLIAVSSNGDGTYDAITASCTGV